MFTSKVYTVMIGSLSGTIEEVFAAKEVVRKYNQENAESFGKLFMPVEWSMNPDGIKNVDVVIGIVGNWINNPDFIEYCIKVGKKVMLFFNIFQDPRNTIQSEYNEVKTFREQIQSHCFCANYCGVTDLCKLLNEQLLS